jgi:predicted transposase/invertase (TIGR01784 family)
MKEAKEIFERAKLDPEAQEIMRVYEKAAYDYGNDVSAAKAEGLVEGRVEGRTEGLAEGEAIGLEKGEAIGELKKARETAARMLSKGMLIEDISDITGLSLKEVQRLKSEKYTKSR